MPRALWLPDVLREAGLTVHEYQGWRTRGSASFDPVGVVVHATAGDRRATDAAELRVLVTGSATAPAPIAQLYLGRQGHWWVVASGRCNHIGNASLPGTGRRGNGYAIGIEAANDNRGEPWPEAQYESYARGVAAICRHAGWPVSRVFGHKEISSSGKTDPTFDMDTFRVRVSALLGGGRPAGLTGEEQIMAVLTDAEVRKMYDYIDKMGWVFVHRNGAWAVVNGVAEALRGIAGAQEEITAVRAGLTALSDQVRAVGESTGMTPEQLAAIEAVVRDAVGDSALEGTADGLRRAAEALQAAAEEPDPVDDADENAGEAAPAGAR